MSGSSRYPITRLVALLLLLLSVPLYALLTHFCPRWLLWTLLIVYLIGAIKLVIVMRAVEHHDNRSSFWTRLYGRSFRLLNRFVAWFRLPRLLASLNLLAFRHELRDYNLHDNNPQDGSSEQAQPGPWKPEYRTARTADGAYNDLEHPMMGAANTPFGRNTPLDSVKIETGAELLTPSPREVSRRLLTRDTFIPATSLNLLAAAWIQFQNHDWFNHPRSQKSFIDVPIRPDDQWHEQPMRVKRTVDDPTSGPGRQRFNNDQTHWWDASQIYGSSPEILQAVRAHEDGRLKLEENGLLPLANSNPAWPHLTGVDQTGFNDNWWLGLSLLHHLFTWEHNAICAGLKREYSNWTDDQLFHTARLINAAQIAKIHTVEWTPGILAHPALQTSMNGNWWGLLGEAYRKAFGRLGDSEVISGIPLSSRQHHAAPYALTEEFVSVYRLHPLIPDDYTFRSLSDHRVLKEADFNDIQANATRPFLEQFSIPDLFYSFGVMHPGAITLHNYPRALQTLHRITRPDEPAEIIDLSTIDVLRDRERGVPRYNAFRQMLRKPRVKSFRKLTPNPQWNRELEEVYEGDIDKVDLMVGMYGEPLPPGFGFSDTAFRIFILMASRRLKSDRFLTTDYTPEVYTPFGLEWIDQSNMRNILLRHVPELAPALARSRNAFAPWTRVS